jgi:hypothetical protein
MNDIQLVTEPHSFNLLYSLAFIHSMNDIQLVTALQSLTVAYSLNVILSNRWLSYIPQMQYTV